MALKSTLALAAALGVFAWSADAEQPAAKVGVISIQGAIAGTKDGQKAAQDLDKKVVPKQKEFESRQAEIAQLQDQYNKGSSVMTDDKRNQVARDIDERKKRLERDMRDSEEDLRNEQQKMLQDLGQRLMAVIDKYGEDHGYTMIFDDSSPNTPLLYASKAIDITQEIITLFDQMSATGRPAAPETSTPGRAPSTKPQGTAQ